MAFFGFPHSRIRRAALASLFGIGSGAGLVSINQYRTLNQNDNKPGFGGKRIVFADAPSSLSVSSSPQSTPSSSIIDSSHKKNNQLNQSDPLSLTDLNNLVKEPYTSVFLPKVLSIIYNTNTSSSEQQEQQQNQQESSSQESVQLSGNVENEFELLGAGVRQVRILLSTSSLSFPNIQRIGHTTLF
jgi:hypothetical protein